MESFLNKKFKLDSSDNFDEYMKALGVNAVMRKIGNANFKSVLTITEKDGVYTMTVTSTVKTQVVTFRLGEECDEETLDGRKIKTVFTLEGNVLTQHQKGEKESFITRTFTDTEMKTVLKIGDVVATRISKLVD